MRKRRVTKNKSKAAILWMWEHTKMIVNCLSVLYVLNWLYSLVVIVGCDKGNRAIQLPRYSYKRNE